MSAFKDAVKADITSVFLNQSEFAEIHKIDGKSIKCILDKNLVEPKEDDSFLGVYENQMTIYVEDGVIDLPKEGQILTVDGSLHLVRKVSVEEGLLVIVVEENRQ